jgi:hypothetical protein
VPLRNPRRLATAAAATGELGWRAARSPQTRPSPSRRTRTPCRDCRPRTGLAAGTHGRLPVAGARELLLREWAASRVGALPAPRWPLLLRASCKLGPGRGLLPARTGSRGSPSSLGREVTGGSGRSSGGSGEQRDMNE